MRRAPPHAGSLRVPSHAAGLRLQERMIFGLIFALMAAFVAVVTVSAAKARNDIVVTTPSGLMRTPVSTGVAASPAVRAIRNTELAAALQPEVSTDPGMLAVAVMDRATGSAAVYNASLRFPAGSIVTADILAALLLQDQQNGTSVAAQDASLATKMIEQGSNAAARRLWRLVGRAAGMQAANRMLKLAHTSVRKDGRLGLTSTTVVDQLQLLSDLTSPGSPLDAGSRAYAVGLLAHVLAGQRWGIPAAASGDTEYEVNSGWLPDPRLAVVNSIGIVRRNGQQLLIVVLSKDNLTGGAGIARAEAAAVTAAEVVTRGSS